MSSTSSTRERILQAGLKLLSVKGFEGITLGVLAEKTQLSKSGLFAHFGSKEQVQLGLLDRLLLTGKDTVLTPALLQPEGLAHLVAVVINWLGWATKAGLPGGCPVAAGMFEFDDLEGPVRAHLLATENEWREFLIGLTRKAIERQELRSTLDVTQFVWELYGIYLSHHVSTYFIHDAEADERAQAAFTKLLTDALPPQEKQRQ